LSLSEPRAFCGLAVRLRRLCAFAASSRPDSHLVRRFASDRRASLAQCFPCCDQFGPCPAFGCELRSHGRCSPPPRPLPSISCPRHLRQPCPAPPPSAPAAPSLPSSPNPRPEAVPRRERDCAVGVRRGWFAACGLSGPVRSPARSPSVPRQRSAAVQRSTSARLLFA